MKQIYTSVKAVCTAVALFGALSASAQNPTYPANTGNCSNVVANFNSGDQGFNSPSVYGGALDSSFYYNNVRDWWTEAAGGQNPEKTLTQGVPRLTTIISPVYPNPNAPGTFDVGFFYIVGNPFTGLNSANLLPDRFQVRIVSATPQGAFTVYNVEASSGARFFSDYSTPTAHVDPVNPLNPLFNGFKGFVCIRLNDVDITNAPGVQYRVEVSYLLNTPNFAVFDDLSLGATAAAPLPVTFMGIVANRNANDVNVRWDVAAEVDVKEYQVERSLNGGTFTTVGTVSANGKSVYSFTDPTSEKNTIYYRLKSVDLDGRAKYSGIVKVKGTGSHSSAARLYPLPARNEVTLEHKRLAAGAQITVTTAEGRTVRVVRPVNGASHTPIDLSNMTPGMYLVRVDDGEGGVETLKLVKQ